MNLKETAITTMKLIDALGLTPYIGITFGLGVLAHAANRLKHQQATRPVNFDEEPGYYYAEPGWKYRSKNPFKYRSNQKKVR